ncbi:MAG: DsbA family protein, partial [Burkholderiales bacterium]|nr:DsbA family protein [Burkholderiales bacterium]
KMDIVVGGLRAYNKEVLDEEKRVSLLGHWKHVEEASGLPFLMTGMSQPGFIYDTEPACRAVVAVRTLADELPALASLSVFRAIQHAFYAEGKDVTNVGVLAQICVAALNELDGGNAFDEASFLETMSSPMCINETRQDFEQVQRWGIRGFPALLLLHENALHMLAAGYTKSANLINAIQELQRV